MRPDVSILIVGAGPTGLAAAVELTRRGLVPRIVDRGAGPTPVEQSRALGVLPVTLDMLTPSGIAARMIGEGLPIDRFRIAREGETLFTLRTRHAPTAHPYILSLPQGRTERIMIDWLAENGVPIAWNRELVALDQDGGRTRARFADGDVATADVLLGCDGIHSSVRSLTGIGWSGEGYPATFALADVRFTRPVDQTVLHADLRSREGTRAFIPFGLSTGRYVGIASSTEALLEGVAGIGDVGWASQFSVSFRHAETLSVGRRFLAGDSAHVHSPVGARGMNLGIGDAATLAFLLSVGRESQYEATRLPVIRDVIASTRAMTDFMRSRSFLIDLAMRFAMPVALRLPFAERFAASRLLALDLPRPEWL